MKSKKATTCFLLFLSVVIWGTIGWKVYSAFNENIPVPASLPKVTAQQKKDTVRLLLNYQDPFLGGYPPIKKTEKASVTSAANVRNESVILPKEEPVPDFQYKGIIRLGKNTQAIINRNGETLLMKVRDKVGEFVILHISDDKITIGRKNKKHELFIQ